MPHVDKKSGELVIRIVYDGTPEAGKTTNIAQLTSMIALQRRGAVESPGTKGARTEFFDWLDFSGGFIDGRRVRCQLVSVPGQPSLLHRRRYLLQAADAIVYVADARREQADGGRDSLKTTTRILERLRSEVPVGVVVQANKQDLPDALDARALAMMLDLPPTVAVVPSVAIAGKGVMETFILASRLATDRVRAMVYDVEAAELQLQHETPDAMYQAMLDLERSQERPGPDSQARPGSNVARELLSEAEQEGIGGAEDKNGVLGRHAPPPTADEGVRLVEQQALRAAEEEARARVEQEALHAAEEEARARAEQQARRVAEEQERARAEQQALRAAEEEARARTEQQARRAAEEEARAQEVRRPTDEQSTGILQDIHREEPLRNTCTPELRVGLGPGLEVSAGHVWPPVKGRALLANASLESLSIPEFLSPWAPHGALEIKTEGRWTLHSSAAWRFAEEAPARVELLSIVRRQLEWGDLLFEGRALFLAPENDGWRLWALTAPAATLRDTLLELLQKRDLEGLRKLWLAVTEISPRLAPNGGGVSVDAVCVAGGRLSVLAFREGRADPDMHSGDLRDNLRRLVAGYVAQDPRVADALRPSKGIFA